MATKILIKTKLQSFPTPTLNGSGYKGISQPTRASQQFASKSAAPLADTILPRKKREYHPFRCGYKVWL